MVDLLEHGTCRAPFGLRGAAATDQAAREQLQALDRVASRTPGISGNRLQSRRLRARPWLGHRAVERIEAGQIEVGGERPQQRSVAAFAGPARHPGQSHEQIDELVARRGLAEHVQTVADLQFLQLAQMIVELAQSGIGMVAGVDADVPVEPEPGAQRQDLAAQVGHAPRVQPCGLVVLVDQALELGQRTVGLGAGQGRRQMVDDYRGRAPLRLRALARDR